MTKERWGNHQSRWNYFCWYAEWNSEYTCCSPS